MIHRMLILIVVACLLGACSSDETASERNSSEPSQTAAVTDPGETLAGQDDAVPVSSGDPVDIEASADTSADTARVEPVESADELAEDSTSPDEPAQDEPVGGPDESGASAAPASLSGLRVLRTYVCKGIEQSEPTEAGKSFIPQDGVLRLCCFSEIAGAAGPDTVLHIWRWGDREMARVVLEVKSPRWRTWSTKRILDEWRGEWHVDVTDSDGVVLARQEFSVE
jgi:hypothetical protein